MAQPSPGPSLDGDWRVRRVSGLLPPGVTKRIASSAGQTSVFGLLFGRFDVVGNRFIYRFWPIVDVIEPDTDGSYLGRGLLLGVRFCRFRLERLR